MRCLGVFGLSWLVGYALCRGALGPAWRGVPLTLRLGLGWAAGAAFSGMTTFWAVALAPGRRGEWVGGAAAFALALSLLRSTREPDGLPPARDAARPGERAAWWVGATAFVAVLAVWFAHGLEIGVGSPAGGWDAWSIWTLRARFFYLGPDEWTRGFDPVLEWSHTEYPNLVPSLIVYGWLPAGRCVALSPIALALMTHVSLLLLLVGFSRAAYPRSPWPWAFGVFYATIPLEWSQEIAWQYADRPLAVFLLAGTGCLALALRQDRQRWLLPAGFCLGAAAFTKDEGKAALLLIGVGASVATLAALCHRGRLRTIGSVSLLALGVTPGLGSLALQYAYSPLPSPLLAKMTAAPLIDTGRTALILQSLLGRCGRPSTGWAWWGCGLAFLTLWPWLRRRELWLLWAVPAAQLMVYLMIFQLTPLPLPYHLESALPRLLFHVGPLAFLAANWLILEAINPADS